MIFGDVPFYMIVQVTMSIETLDPTWVRLPQFHIVHTLKVILMTTNKDFWYN